MDLRKSMNPVNVYAKVGMFSDMSGVMINCIRLSKV